MTCLIKCYGYCQIVDYTLGYQTMRPVILRCISEEATVGKPAINDLDEKAPL